MHDATGHVHIYVALTQDADGYPPYEVEELDAVHLSDESSARVTATPAFVYGLARGDVVRVQSDGEGRLWVAEILEDAGHACARIVPLGGTSEESILREFTELGCTAAKTQFGLLTIDIPPTTAVAPVVAALNRGRNAGAWDYDFGVSPTS